jgi:hypothetical protein
MERRPYSRGEYNRALITNALLAPFNIVLLALMLIAGILLGILVPVLPVAVVVYLAAAARTYFDDDAAQKVLERERSKHRKEIDRGRKRALPEDLAPEIARLVEAARERETRIRTAIERAELPYERWPPRSTASSPRRRARRAARSCSTRRSPTRRRPRAGTAAPGAGRPEKAELAEALSTQLETLQRMERQLGRFYGELERIIVELDTVRSQLVSMSASTETAQQDRLAGRCASCASGWARWRRGWPPPTSSRRRDQSRPCGAHQSTPSGPPGMIRFGLSSSCVV